MRRWQLVCLAALAAGCSRSEERAAASERAIAIRGARVFDGNRVIPRATVVVRGGRIAAVGPDVAIPAGAEIVEAAGKTLLPGLIDSHTHGHEPEVALEQSLALGVTTELGMMEAPDTARRLRAESPSRASLHSAGWAVTVDGGLGTEEGDPIPTLAAGDDPKAFVAARRSEGSEYIEIMFDDGSAWGVPHPALAAEQLAGVVNAAHAAGLLTLADIATHAEAAKAIEAGVDGLAHLYIEGPAPALAKRIAAAHAFVMATLPVLFSICDGSRGGALADDPAIAPYLMPAAERALRQSYVLFSPGADCKGILAAVRELSSLGVAILAGSDAGSPGTTHGASVHDALALLVEAGLTPTEALATATSVPARTFHLAEVGRIAPGMRADLVLVDGDPTTDIRTTRAIATVWKAGVALDRSRHRAAAAAARAVEKPSRMAAGGVGRFEDDDGDGWQAKSDRMRGGSSQAELLLVDRGGGSSGGALEVSGHTADGGWAGAMRFLASEPPASVDLSALRSLRFAARGDGGRVRVLLYTLRGGATPVEIGHLTAGPRWSETTLALPAERGEVVAILFSAGPDARAFRFAIDDVELR